MPYESRDLAWATGLFEGEGTFYIGSPNYTGRDGKQHPRRKRHPVARMVMTDVEPLEEMRRIFGGSIHGPYTFGNEKWKPQYHWQLHSFEKVQALIAAMWPRLSPRRRGQAAAALGR